MHLMHKKSPELHTPFPHQFRFSREVNCDGCYLETQNCHQVFHQPCPAAAAPPRQSRLRAFATSSTLSLSCTTCNTYKFQTNTLAMAWKCYTRHPDWPHTAASRCSRINSLSQL